MECGEDIRGSFFVTDLMPAKVHAFVPVVRIKIRREWANIVRS